MSFRVQFLRERKATTKSREITTYSNRHQLILGTVFFFDYPVAGVSVFHKPSSRFALMRARCPRTNRRVRNYCSC